MKDEPRSQNARLRFAALRRVSTEQQEKYGESLRTQATNLKRFVETFRGSIVAWYGGQEHATPGFEKKEVERLIADAQKKRFDAVIVNDADRWSRDNSHSKLGLEVLRQYRIRFFTGGTEWDLFNPSHVLFLSMSAVIGEFHALNQKRKSLENRIERAKRGIPTGGKLPFGRTFNKETGKWGYDPQKRQMIQDCAKRYLAGEGIEDLATEYSVNASNLHKVLTKVSGPKWQLVFDSKDLNISATVAMDIPPLLDDATIKAIHQKAKMNRTYYHGKKVNEYLLARMVFCVHCGYAMFGQTNPNRHRYYRHAHAKRDRECPGAKRKTWIPADKVENAVLRQLFETFGNPAAVQKAIEAATPNNEKIQDARRRLGLIVGELEKLKAARKRIIDWSVKEIIPDRDATDKLEELKTREQRLTDKRTQLEDELRHIPSPESVKAASKHIARRFRTYTNASERARLIHINTAFDEMTYAEKRELCEMVFNGERVNGSRMGIGITWSKDGGKWKYQIEGRLISEIGLTNSQRLQFDGSAIEQKDLVEQSAWRSPNKVLPALRSGGRVFQSWM